MAYRLGGLDAIEEWLRGAPPQVAQERLWDWLVSDLAMAPQRVPSVPLPGTTAEVFVFPDEDVDIAVTYVVARESQIVHLVAVESLGEPFFGPGGRSPA